ncbi:MAG: hypothetical protein ACYS7Y_04225 [Planctomycetota bacterium]|jgi:hypothetical protein
MKRKRIGRGRKSIVTSQDIPFIVRGEVVKVIPLQGSFINVEVEHENGISTHTINMSDDFTFAKLGDRIQVTGTLRNGRYITREWKFI